MPKIFLLLNFLFLCLSAFASVEHRCPVCWMSFKDKSKISFKMNQKSEVHHLCSFVCTRKLSKKFHDATIYAVDFDSSEWIDTQKAYFLIKSKTLLREIEFGMPPSVVAFSSEEAANKKLKTLQGDGKIIFNWKGLEKSYE